MTYEDLKINVVYDFTGIPGAEIVQVPCPGCGNDIDWYSDICVICHYRVKVGAIN